MSATAEVVPPKRKLRRRAVKPKPPPKGLTGLEVQTLRAVLGWSRDEFALLLVASPSAVQRWEQRGTEPVPLEARNRATLEVLNHVLATQPNAAQMLKEFRREGLRAMYVLLGMYYGDTPWIETPTKPMKRLPDGVS